MFALLRRDAQGCMSPKSQELLQTLCVMARHEDPTAFFNFGDDTAGILRNTDLPFPGASSLILQSAQQLLGPCSGCCVRVAFC